MASRFHERFDIPVEAEEAQRRFLNRAYNTLLTDFINKQGFHEAERIKNNIVTQLGELYERDFDLSHFILDDFHKVLEALEALYHTYRGKEAVRSRIQNLIDMSEVDLGIRWENEQFIPSGARLLDEKFVNEPLHWLSDQRYESVLGPFKKGLQHFLHSRKRPELLPDVVTDMYEALEALAKIVTGRSNKDLSANKDLFLKKAKASEPYKNLLRDYITYANQFRHAVEEGAQKPELSPKEVESFIYMTGLFLRLAMD